MLIAPAKVISTPYTVKPAACTASMVRTISPDVKRNGFRVSFCFLGVTLARAIDRLTAIQLVF